MTPLNVRRSYAEFVFDVIVDANGCNHDGRISWIFTEYFAASSLNVTAHFRPDALNGWPLAFWEIRTRLGRDFTDRMISLAAKANPYKSRDHTSMKLDLNADLGKRLQMAIWAVKNDDSQILETYRILGLHGLGN